LNLVGLAGRVQEQHDAWANFMSLNVHDLRAELAEISFFEETSFLLHNITSVLKNKSDFVEHESSIEWASSSLSVLEDFIEASHEVSSPDVSGLVKFLEQLVAALEN